MGVYPRSPNRMIVMLKIVLIFTSVLILPLSGSTSSTTLCGDNLEAFYKVVEEENATIEGSCCNKSSNSNSGEFTCSSVKTCANQCGRSASNCATLIFNDKKQKGIGQQRSVNYCSG